jgi:hypothetical protein
MGYVILLCILTFTGFFVGGLLGSLIVTGIKKVIDIILK